MIALIQDFSFITGLVFGFAAIGVLAFICILIGLIREIFRK